MKDHTLDLLKIEPYRKLAREFSSTAKITGAISMGFFAASFYLGFGNIGWKLFVAAVALSFFTLILIVYIAIQDQTAAILQHMYELPAAKRGGDGA